MTISKHHKRLNAPIDIAEFTCGKTATTILVESRGDIYKAIDHGYQFLIGQVYIWDAVTKKITAVGLRICNN